MLDTSPLGPGGCVTLATAVAYDRRPAAVIWPLVAIVHRRIVPRLLRRATQPSAPATR